MNAAEKAKQEETKAFQKLARLNDSGPFIVLAGFLVFAVGFANTYGVSLGILITMGFAVVLFFVIPFFVRMFGGPY